jgi:SAM-dependent methyltransferase
VSAPLTLRQTRCAFCGTLDNAVEAYGANFDLGDFNPAVFSARRMPDRLHYRMVRCKRCGLLRSDPVADSQMLERLYRQSVQSYDGEISNLRSTYGGYLDLLRPRGRPRRALLEIGCGSGFFLEEARLRGYDDVWGIEPSEAAADQAAPGIREHIIRDVLRPGLLGDETFDAICMFQVFDHLADPNEALDVCFRLLRPGGQVLALNHDAGSLSARLLGERSPIIDIEHTYLYDRRSMAAMFAKHGFEVLRTGRAHNRYSLQYLGQLMPLPAGAKKALLELLRKSGRGSLRLRVGLGNLFLIARRPGGTAEP